MGCTAKKCLNYELCLKDRDYKESKAVAMASNMKMSNKTKMYDKSKTCKKQDNCKKLACGKIGQLSENCRIGVVCV